jgi:hypothetical protein
MQRYGGPAGRFPGHLLSLATAGRAPTRKRVSDRRGCHDNAMLTDKSNDIVDVNVVVDCSTGTRACQLLFDRGTVSFVQGIRLAAAPRPPDDEVAGLQSYAR